MCHHADARTFARSLRFPGGTRLPQPKTQRADRRAVVVARGHAAQTRVEIREVARRERRCILRVVLAVRVAHEPSLAQHGDPDQALRPRLALLYRNGGDVVVPKLICVEARRAPAALMTASASKVMSWWTGQGSSLRAFSGASQRQGSWMFCSSVSLFGEVTGMTRAAIGMLPPGFLQVWKSLCGHRPSRVGSVASAAARPHRRSRRRKAALRRTCRFPQS